MPRLRVLFASIALGFSLSLATPVAQTSSGYPALVKLFQDFVAAERPTVRECAPDYSVAATTARAARLKALQTRLAAIDPKGWAIPQQVDRALVAAELNALDFDLRVLRPWARDPAFYQSVWMD